MNAPAFCLTSAGCFFLVGLVCGAWKYARIRGSSDVRAPPYVDLAHRSALLYAFAGMLLAQLAEHSAWTNTWNLVAAIILQVFFAASVVAYVVHGVLGDTDNQFRRPHRLGNAIIPPVAMTTFMALLIVAEIAAFCLIFSGYLVARCGTHVPLFNPTSVSPPAGAV